MIQASAARRGPPCALWRKKQRPAGWQGLPHAEAMQRLLRLRGIGRWSAEYVLLRGLGRLDVFPGRQAAGVFRSYRAGFRPKDDGLKVAQSQRRPINRVLWDARLVRQ
ncbi:hypothetical protein ACJU26_04550 [Acidithiobacillus sp. M4-SHS-6]|uniref:hypothetical protein n=1 Tax=Acidithiobacillus sp. M4-SHS-6 TaxID=3383024 RepID=UPI0039BEA4ED